ncbi:response regulator transcription factor [Burkholderia sp. JPY481]
MTEARILIVEDDTDIRTSLVRFLVDRGFTVQEADSAEAASKILRNGEIDLVLLDIMLPGKNGLDLCRQLRASGGPRIIMLTALAEPTDKVTGLELGADDYVCKPFDLGELLARIRALLRRVPMQGATSLKPVIASALMFSGFTFFPYRRFARSPAGIRIPLTGAETDLLLVFCQHPRQVLSREELISWTRGEGFPIAVRSIDLLVSRLRRKLCGDDVLDDLIRTARSDGYSFQADVTAS